MLVMISQYIIHSLSELVCFQSARLSISLFIQIGLILPFTSPDLDTVNIYSLCTNPFLTPLPVHPTVHAPSPLVC